MTSKYIRWAVNEAAIALSFKSELHVIIGSELGRSNPLLYPLSAIWNHSAYNSENNANGVKVHITGGGHMIWLEPYMCLRMGYLGELVGSRVILKRYICHRPS